MVVGCSSRQLFPLRSACSSGSLRARCLFVQVCRARSHIACVELAGFGNGGWLAVSLTLQMLSLLTGPAESSRVRAQASGLRCSASAPGLDLYRHPPPPNNSFKPTPHRGVNSVLCATLHAVATPPRGGLTQALGGRKALNSWVVRNRDSSASVGIALRILCRRVITSFESVDRAHTSHALSYSASETVIGLRSVCRSRNGRFGNIRLKVLGCAPRPPGFDFRQVH